MSTEDVRAILGNPSVATNPDGGRVVWIFHRGLYYSLIEPSFSGDRFGLWVEFYEDKYMSHRLTFFYGDTSRKV